jgi:hypothetical protein
MVLHFGSVNKALNMSFSFSLSSSIALVLLFVPKLYIILFKPEKNVIKFLESQFTLSDYHLS